MKLHLCKVGFVLTIVFGMTSCKQGETRSSSVAAAGDILVPGERRMVNKLNCVLTGKHIYFGFLKNQCNLSDFEDVSQLNRIELRPLFGTSDGSFIEYADGEKSEFVSGEFPIAIDVFYENGWKATGDGGGSGEAELVKSIENEIKNIGQGQMFKILERLKEIAERKSIVYPGELPVRLSERPVDMIVTDFQVSD